MPTMGWLRLVGLIKLYVSFAKEPYKTGNILQKRPTIWSILITIATPLSLFFPLPHLYVSTTVSPPYLFLPTPLSPRTIYTQHLILSILSPLSLFFPLPHLYISTTLSPPYSCLSTPLSPLTIYTQHLILPTLSPLSLVFSLLHLYISTTLSPRTLNLHELISINPLPDLH